MGQGPQRAEVVDTGRKSLQSVAVGDVEDERLDDGPADRGGQVGGRHGHGRLVPIDQQQRVDHGGELLSAGTTHPAPRTGGDAHRCHRRLPAHSTSGLTAWLDRHRTGRLPTERRGSFSPLVWLDVTQ